MGDFGSGSMLALPFNQVESASFAEHFGCQVATINIQQQTVVGGTEFNIDQLQEHITTLHPKKRTVKLDTEGAFHTDLMKDAADEFKTILDRTNFGPLNIPVLSNYSADTHPQDGNSTANLLYQQLYKPVNWLGCMQASLNYKIDTIIEFGGGIGKDDKPEKKRPNLEAMTKRNFRSFAHEINYYSSINTSTLTATANSLLNL
jgi:[acyl-carrier-protein] S-malonyltransferase